MIGPSVGGAGFSRPRVGRAKVRPDVRLLTVAFCLLPSAFLIGQQPTRDAPAAPVAGPGALVGVVLDDASGRPLRRAAVNLTGGSFRGSHTAVTDEAGRFGFTALPLAQYTVNAQKPGYVDTFYGSRRSGRGPGQPVALTTAEPSAAIALRMPRGAVLTGVVTQGDGRPAAYVQVTVLQHRMQLGERRLTPAPFMGQSSTDDRGVYRLYGLPAGEYVVRAAPQIPNTPPVVTSGQVQWAQQQIALYQTGRAVTSGQAASGAPPDSGRAAYADIYYPGTPDPNGTVTITLGAGEERTGVDFVLDAVPTARIAGTVIDPTGAGMPQGQLRLIRPGLVGSPGVNTSRTPDGRFTISDVPPGQYVVFAGTGGPGGVSQPSGGPASWGTAEVIVSGTDIADVTIALRPMMAMSGRVSLESAAGLPQEVANLRISLDGTARGDGFPTVAPTTSVKLDGTFSLTGILPGRYRLVASGPTPAGASGSAANWLVKSILVQGRDVTDRVFEIKADDQLQDVAVVLTDRPAELSGTLLDPAGQPASDYSIVLFSADREFWGLQTRRTLRSPPASDGRFRFRGLLPGDYYVCALAGFDPGDTDDPTFYEALVSGSLRLTLAEGEKKVQDLRLAGQF